MRTVTHRMVEPVRLLALEEPTIGLCFALEFDSSLILSLSLGTWNKFYAFRCIRKCNES